MFSNRKLNTEITQIILGRIFLSGSSVLLLVLLIVNMDTTNYALYVFFFSTASWLSALIFVAANIPILNLVASNSRSGINERLEIRDFIYTISVVSFVFAIIVCSFLSYFILNTIDQPNYSPKTEHYLYIGLLSASIGCFTLVINYFVGMRMRVADAIANTSLMILRCLFVIGTFIVVGKTAPSALLAITLATLVSLFFIYRQSVKPATLVNPLYAYRILKKNGFINNYFRNWPVALGNNMFLFGDKVFLAYFLPIEAIGLLALYQQFIRLLSNLSSGVIYQLFAPILLGNKNENESETHVYKPVILSIAILLVLSVLAFALLFIVNIYIFDRKFELSFFDYTVIAITVSLNGGSRILELTFFKCNRVNLLAMPLITSVIVLVILGILLSKLLGITGATVALLAGAFVRIAYVYKNSKKLT